MKNAMMTVAQATAAIEAGKVLVIAAAEEALCQLPRGRWIGGTTVYFITDTGGCTDRENLFVTEIGSATAARPALYATRDLPDLTQGRYDNGLSVIIIPAFSAAQEEFALHAPRYPDLLEQPLMGWISGVHLDDPDTIRPKVFDGSTGAAYTDGAMVMHVELPPGKVAEIDILNIFAADETADEIIFETTGFSARTAIVNGERVDFADYLENAGIDTRCPLVTNFAGTAINVSFQSTNSGEGVHFYAPVIKDTPYRIARAHADYAKEFSARPMGDGTRDLSCNCLLNYLYSDLERQKTGTFTGPATYSGIAYFLVNQVVVRLGITSVDAAAA
ncbi:DUF6976 family protein [Salipiger aestuarii]|uniref:DUF6976 family protein n=1 Tax=Salipiger aestuarii TaxID=568098 RepID=UPI001CC2E93E|nr:hypothetical protein [Salipiger aestuarii]KAA8614165.1 hypothetical protein AL037_04215 [Salipiger aestuarii]